MASSLFAVVCDPPRRSHRVAETPIPAGVDISRKRRHTLCDLCLTPARAVTCSGPSSSSGRTASRCALAWFAHRQLGDVGAARSFGCCALCSRKLACALSALSGCHPRVGRWGQGRTVSNCVFGVSPQGRGGGVRVP